MAPKGTPMTRSKCIIDAKIYSINQDNEFITFDLLPLLFHKKNENVLNNVKFGSAEHIKNAIKEYYLKIDKLKRDLFKNVFLTNCGDNLIVVGHDNKLLFINTRNGKVKCLDLSAQLNGLGIIYDFGVLNDKLLYFIGQEKCDGDVKRDKIFIYKLNKDLDAKYIGYNFINSKFGSLRYKFRGSSIGNGDQIILWLMGKKYIKIRFKIDLSKMSVISYDLNLTRQQLNGAHLKIVEAIKVDDENTILYYANGAIVKFNHVKDKVICITNPVKSNYDRRMNRETMDKKRMIQALILPEQNHYESLCKKLVIGYVRKEYDKKKYGFVPLALKSMMERYYEEYKASEVIIFIGEMIWKKEIGRDKKLHNLTIITAGKYSVDGKYDEIKGSKMHYKQPEKL